MHLARGGGASDVRPRRFQRLSCRVINRKTKYQTSSRSVQACVLSARRHRAHPVPVRILHHPITEIKAPVVTKLRRKRYYILRYIVMLSRTQAVHCRAIVLHTIGATYARQQVPHMRQRGCTYNQKYRVEYQVYTCLLYTSDAADE